MTDSKTTTTTAGPKAKATHVFFIDGRPVPPSHRLAHIAARWARHDDGCRMSSPQLREHLVANGAPEGDLLAKTWTITIGGGHKLSSKIAPK